MYRLFEGLNATLQPAIEDTAGIFPGPAYTAFFKSAKYLHDIHHILSNVSIGAIVPERVWFPGLLPNPAKVICLTGVGQMFVGHGKDVYMECITQNARTQILDSSWAIVICPAFFTSYHALPPTSHDQCLSIDPKTPTELVGSGSSLIDFQLFALFGAVASLYIRTIWDRNYEGRVWTVNSCLSLTASRASMNPQSYMFYLASTFAKSPHSHHWLLRDTAPLSKGFYGGLLICVRYSPRLYDIPGTEEATKPSN